MTIHLSEQDEKRFIEEGMNKQKVSDASEIVQILSDRFVTNRSIFIQENKNKNKQFRILGDFCSASLQMERPGVYLMTKLRFGANRDHIFGLSQVFGEVGFCTNAESATLRGNTQEEIKLFKTNEIFEAWEQFLEFEKAVYKDELPSHIYHYDRAEIIEDRIKFHIQETLDPDTFMALEYEFITSASVNDDLPKNADDIVFLKDGRDCPKVIIRKPNYLDGDNYVWFDIPNYDIPENLESCGGILYLSDCSYLSNNRRKERTIQEIKSRSNKTANIVMHLSESDVTDYSLGTDFEAVSNRTLDKMFGNHEIRLKDNYMNAMKMALNTPDIALIQGPPGTGKTTLIQGIINRLNELGKNYKVLVSSEQHEALDNVVSKISKSDLLPPYVSSRRYDEDQDDSRFFKNIEEYQSQCNGVCNEILRSLDSDSNKSKSVLRILTIVQEIKDAECAPSVIASNLDDLEMCIKTLGKQNDATEFLSKLKVASTRCSKKLQFQNPADALFIQLIESQRTTLVAFQDDGAVNLRGLLPLLKQRNIVYLDEYSEIIDDMLSFDDERIEKSFDYFAMMVEKLKNEYIPHTGNVFDNDVESLKDALDSIVSVVLRKPEDGKLELADIVEKFSFQMNDANLVANIVKKYTPVIGSTCAQSRKSADYTSLNTGCYDYVVVDEAARANPIDIMIPILMGSRVLLVGDHYQLPHYIETDVMNKFKESPEKYTKFKEELLKKSLFQLIYENLDLAFSEHRLRYRRTAMLSEQHRMHPTIGNFISSEFYSGALINAAETSENINNYGIFDGKNIACVDIPTSKGLEEHSGGSLLRKCEIKQILEILKDLVKKNVDTLPTVGIMSFYKAQVNFLNKAISDTFSENICEKLSCGTVDSYQGKEFDIVILSGVRSNVPHNLGFIKESSSRVNVALSRAKKLLIFVGDEDTFRSSPHFDHLFKYCNKLNKEV